MSESYPPAADLLSAVSEFLQGDVAAALTDNALQFKLKIAVNVLAIVQREIVLGPANAEAKKETWSALLGEEGGSQTLQVRLSEAIAAGKFDGGDSELLSVLEAQTLRQLAIDNPKYSTYQALINDTSVL